MNIRKIKILLPVLVIMLFAACQDEMPELGTLPEKSSISYSVTQAYDIDPGGNTVILRNETPGTVAMWDYGTGRSNRQQDTIRIAFTGTYTIKFSAMTEAGIVEMDPVTIEVTEDNLNYVNDPLWTALSGGVGNEKTWLLDLDADGVSKYFDGPLYFYSTERNSNFECLYPDDGGLCWNWNPDYSGNTWLMPTGDYGTMTFSLKGGPFVTVDHKMLPARGVESGTYFLDVNTNMLTMTDAAPLHNEGNDGCVADWGNAQVVSLTEDAMQLAVLRKASCDGEVWLVYNFISQEYSDKWVPEDVEPELDEGFDPSFEPGELLEMLAGGPSQGRVWELDADGNAVDWVAGGIGWTSSSNDSRPWGWNDSWVTAVSDAWIRFDRFGGTQNYTRYQNGVETTGTFTINEATNEVILSDGNTLLQNPDSWMNPGTSTLKVVKAFPDEFESKGIWFGTSYDAGKDEWLVFHYIIP